MIKKSFRFMHSNHPPYAHCEVVMKEVDGKVRVIITDPSNNFGISVTNAIEEIAKELYLAHLIGRRYDEVEWITVDLNGEKDIVTFRPGFVYPHWEKYEGAL